MAKRGIGILFTAVALGSLAAFLARNRTSADAKQAEAQPTSAVQRGPLTISIAQAGTIQAMEQQIIISEVEGQTAIIYLIEEGTRVKKDDLLVELDASALQDKLVEQQIFVQNAEAAYVRARENLAVVKNQTESDISLAESSHRFAKEDLTQYTEGQYKQDLMTAESKITLAEEELQLASRKLEWSEKLFKENYVSQSERDADRLSYNRAKLDLDLARAAKKLLQEFTYTRSVAKLASDVEQTARAMERVKLKSAADLVLADSDLKTKEAERRKQQGKEEKIKDQIAKTRIKAPRDGLVVYATSVRTSSWRGTQEPLEVGQTVRERHELIYLPTADEMIAAIQVHESNLEKVRLGLPVVVTVDALKGRTFVGQISRIAPLPDATSMWINPDLKVYRTEIKIEGLQPQLRTGMSCMAEIIVDRYEDSLYVPVQAVLRVDGNPTVYVRQGSEFKPVPVEVGLDNNRMIRILKGLDAGQTVLLTPPLKEAAMGEDRPPGNGGLDQKRMSSMIQEANRIEKADPSANNHSPAGVAAPEGGREHGASTPEQRAERRRKIESLTPEQRKEMLIKPGGGPKGQRPGGAP